MKTILKEIKEGELYKGNINKELFKITKIDNNKGKLYFENKGRIFEADIATFKRCLLTKEEL